MYLFVAILLHVGIDFFKNREGVNNSKYFIVKITFH